MEPVDLPRGAGTLVSLLGGFHVTHDGMDVRFPTRKAASLFAYLALNHGKRVSRDRLCGILWPEVEDVRARRNLSTTLWRVSRVVHGLTDAKLHADHNHVVLGFGVPRVDALEFLRAAQTANSVEGDQQIAILQEVERLFIGDLLDGFRDEWCEDERRSIRQTYYDVVRKLARVLQSQGDYNRSLLYLRKLLQHDSYDEALHREYMLVHYLSGNRAAALAHYGELKKLLASELGVSPESETVQLYENVRVQAEVRLDYASLSGHVPFVGAARGHSSIVPIIGREDELAEVTHALEMARRGIGGATAFCGGPGIGKTRLMEAAMTEARLRGVDVLSAQCPDSNSPAPYQVLVQAIWPRVSHRLLPNSLWASVIKALVDAVSSEQPRHSRIDGRLAEVDRTVLNECILTALVESSDSSPTLLILEDLHKVDNATETFLTTLLPRLPRMRLQVLMTLREDEARGKHVLASLSANGVKVRLLEPLTRIEVSRFAAAVLGAEDVEKELSEFVWDRSAGVPLFVLELVKFLHTEGCINPDRAGRFVLDDERLRSRPLELPSGVTEVVRQRVRLLDTKARELLFAATVLGMEARYEHLEALTGAPEDEFIQNVERLVELRLVRETDNGLHFSHEVIRQSIRGLMSRTRLRMLHARAAAAIEKTMPGRTPELAWHFLEAGKLEKAVAYFEIAGDKARMVHANDDAIRSYSEALHVLESLDLADPRLLRSKAALLLKRQESLDLIGDRTQQTKDVDTLHLIASKLADSSLQAHASLLRCQVLTRLNKSREALDAAREADSLFRHARDRLGAARAQEVMGLVYVSLRNRRRAEACFNQALTLFREAEDRAGEARVLVNLGTMTGFGGGTETAISYLDQAEDVLRGLPDQRSLAVALFQKGVLYRYMGRNAESQRFLLNGIALMKQVGDRIGEARGLSQLGCTYAAMGRFRDSLRESLGALRLAKDAQDIRALIMFQNNIAYSVYRCLGDWARAQRSIFAALDMVTRSGVGEDVAIYHDTMAAILIEKGEPERAMHWLKRAQGPSRGREDRPGFVDTDMTFRAASIHMLLGQLDKALPLALKAIDRWRRGGDIALLAHGVSLLGRLRLEMGDLSAALRSARELEALLRRVDGVEQVQKLYWHQYLVFRRVGAHAAARKALRRAFHAVVEQAMSLKGRLRRKFLASIHVNREIMDEAVRLRMVSGQGTVILDAARLNAIPPRDSDLLMDARGRIEARRRSLLTLIRRGPLRQKDVATLLRVSVRTVRGDLMALRAQGLVANPMMRRQPDAPQDVVS